MKKLVIILFLIVPTILLNAEIKNQENIILTLNESTNFYEYSHVKENPDNKLIDKFKNRLTELNYKDIVVADNQISGQGFTNHLVSGFATVEIHYLVKIAFKENRYKLTLTNFILKDKNGNNPLEGMGSFKNRWIKIIDEKLPAIIKNIENLESTDNNW